MIFEIVKSRVTGEPCIVECSASRWTAWDLLELLKAAGLHKNAHICCYAGYENAVYFAKSNWR